MLVATMACLSPFPAQTCLPAPPKPPSHPSPRFPGVVDAHGVVVPRAAAEDSQHSPWELYELGTTTEAGRERVAGCYGLNHSPGRAWPAALRRRLHPSLISVPHFLAAGHQQEARHDAPALHPALRSRLSWMHSFPAPFPGPLPVNRRRPGARRRRWTPRCAPACWPRRSARRPASALATCLLLRPSATRRTSQ